LLQGAYFINVRGKRQSRAGRVDTPRRRSIAVLIEFARGYGWGLLSGVAQFVREHHEVSVQTEEWRWTDAIPAWFRNWTGDGVIAWVETDELAEVIRQLGVPAVDVRGCVAGAGLPVVGANNRAVAKLAAEHLISRQFRNYAYAGSAGANYSDIRSQWFQEELKQAGFLCGVYQLPGMSREIQALEPEKRDSFFESHFDEWLKTLPKPVGIMACNDIRGQQIINACHRVNLAVPEEVAVVGVDNDPIFCHLCDPPLSSVELDAAGAGYQAAVLLERLIQGQKAPAERIEVPPVGVVARRSTDILATNDRELAAGARFLHERAFSRITTLDMARAAGMSRRVFERRFAALFGRSPKAEVLRLRMERVKELLLHTDWTLAEIAEQTGFKHSEYLHAVCSQKLGLSPGEFRRRGKTQ